MIIFAYQQDCFYDCEGEDSGCEGIVYEMNENTPTMPCNTFTECHNLQHSSSYTVFTKSTVIYIVSTNSSTQVCIYISWLPKDSNRMKL